MTVMAAVSFASAQTATSDPRRWWSAIGRCERCTSEVWRNRDMYYMVTRGHEGKRFAGHPGLIEKHAAVAEEKNIEVA